MLYYPYVRVMTCKTIKRHVVVVVVAGEYLKEKYEGAIEVRATRRGRLQIRDPRFSLPTSSDLVYIDDSPNYCIRNITAGSIGNEIIIILISDVKRSVVTFFGTFFKYKNVFVFFRFIRYFFKFRVGGDEKHNENFFKTVLRNSRF